MQNIIDSFSGNTRPVHGRPAVRKSTDVAFDEMEIAPALSTDQGFDLIEIALVPGGKVVKADNPLIEAQQRFQQIRADETGHPGDQPNPRPPPKTGLDRFVITHRLLLAHTKSLLSGNFWAGSTHALYTLS